MFTKINHIGIAVFSIEAALKFYRDILGLKVSSIQEVSHEGVRVAILPVGEGRIELLEPLNEKSPLHAILQKRGEGIHHLALQSTAIDEDVKALSQQGISTLEDPRPGTEGTMIAFIHPKLTHGVLMEVCQEANY